MILSLCYWKYQRDSHRDNFKVMWGQKLCSQTNPWNMLKFYMIILLDMAGLAQ